MNKKRSRQTVSLSSVHIWKFLRQCLEECRLLFSSVQSLSHVRLFATPWIAACQASLSITNPRSSPKLMSIDNHDGVITHLEPDILECEVKWALERLLLVNENCVSHPIRPPHILCEGCSFITQDVCIWGTSGALLQVLSSSTFFILVVLGFHYATQAFLVVACGLSCLAARGIFVSPPGIEPASPALEGRFLTMGPLGKVSQIQLLFQAWKQRLVLHGLQFDWSRHCLTGSQITHVVCVSTPGFLSPWRNHLTLTCVLLRNLGKTYASWGNSWITRGLKQAHHLFFLSPAMALHCLLSFREFPGQETTVVFDCRFDNTSLVYSLLFLTLLSLTPHPEITLPYQCDQTLSLTFFLEQFKLRCL